MSVFGYDEAGACVSVEGREFSGHWWVERMVEAIEAAVHEDARRQDRWSPDVWAEVSR